ncbi:protein HOTHEAD-like isoform X1 [Chenopodium quinoa]|uniref:protein HOTHEAD-like isoform X1 n=1 Tax=Chenopodium quinoa TaxID=63459 RepID=UPI000B795B7F|nr:protein HOTHEAD-like isoform X1 [Chenopodium quinoa]
MKKLQETRVRIWFLIHSILSIIYLSASASPTASPLCNNGLKVEHPNMTSDVTEIEGKSFDYIIIGGGACGCPLAATLSEKYSVLVIERGDSPYGNPTILERTKFGYPLVETNKYTSVAQEFVSLDGVLNYRGRVLGGSTAINSGFYSRASDAFIKKMGWNEKMVKQAYEWVESKVVFAPETLSPWQSVVLDGLLEAGVLPFNGYTLEHVEGTKLSGTIFDVLGKRHTAADLLGGGNAKNIVVLLNATVSKVFFHHEEAGEEPRAKGVKFIKSDDDTKKSYKVHLKKQENSSLPKGEVILTAGALSSPQILMLSGIGPSKHLQSFNISVLANLKGVGNRMQDNPAISLLVDSKPKSRVPDTPQVTGITENFKVILESIIVPVSKGLTRVSIAGKLAFPASTGTLELNNKDPRENPLVKFNYLSKDEDMEYCVKIHQLVEGVSMSEAVSVYLGSERNRLEKLGKEESKEYCKKNVSTFYHYHGGCTIGEVVDKDYKVYGIKGLRVMDGSTLVESPGTNPMGTLMMLGRYQGLKILEGRKSS